ncbi:hypothetical protein [Bacillus sp. SJS]|uniref:hypothetical protein n=1 Tax=Bacillus sp. SJS TaxID=1423321 RepID=UPI0004DCF362|nr:hypothetical protein [Bacillus sp. SJS]KZZ83909.1 hypothetical protein AS29_014260 [Bacillus sp. SJS]
MLNKLFNYIDNEKYVSISLVVLFVLLFIVSKVTTLGTIILLYLIMGLFYLHIIRKSIRKSNTIFFQIIWLLIMPFIIALLPMLVIDIVIKGDIMENSFSTPLYILFFVLTWVFAVYVFEYSKIKVAIQFINASVLSILGITFLVYFNPEFLKILFGKLIEEIEFTSLSAESIFDILIRLITLPYFLACLWANFAIELRGYQISKKCERKMVSIQGTEN